MPKKGGRKKRRSTDRREVMPEFQPIKPSLQNISEVMSIMNVHANVMKVGKTSKMREMDVYGWLGNGDITSVLEYSDILVLADNFVYLNEYVNGEISTAIINIISGTPALLQTHTTDFCEQLGNDRKKLFIDAAFAQYFIYTKERSFREAPNDQSILFNDHSSNFFCFIRNNDSVFLITGDHCYDATNYFNHNVWQIEDGEIHGNFCSLLSDDNFLNSNGRLFAVLSDKKLQIAHELKELQDEYTTKFGSYETDKSLSPEDWDEIISLNATISEAELFDLEVDEDHTESMNSSSIANLSSVISQERFNLLQKIKNKERELRAEQERFKYHLIPGKDVEEARSQFYETWISDTADERRMVAKKMELVSVLRNSTKGNA